MPQQLQQQRILLVDDEEDIRDIFSDVLTQNGFSVLTAENGLKAQEVLAKEVPFDLVVSDMRMPQANGVTILKWIKSNRPTQKIIYFTGFADSTEVKDAYEMGVRTFLSKPISPKDFVIEVKNYIATGAAPNASPAVTAGPDPITPGGEIVEGESGAFGRIPVVEFISGKTISYPIYMRMNDGKFLKIAHTGEDLAPERVTKMREKGINEFWLGADDFKKYAALNKRILNAVMTSGNFTPEKRMELIRSASSVASENLKVTGVTPDSLKEAEAVLDLTLKNGFTGAEVSNSLFAHIGSLEQANFSHSSMCGMLVALMTLVMDWSSKKNIMSVTMAAFLHDIGVGQLPKELQDKDYDTMNEDELKEYQWHPMMGAELLRKSGAVAEDVIMAIEQHHEDVRGAGYPKKLARVEIFPMSRIVFLVDHFCDELMRYPVSRRAQAPEILNALLLAQRGAYDQNAAHALMLVLTAKSLDQAKLDYKRKANS